jgi:predicted DNA-binding transcriptional regulator AlpA
VTGPSPLRETGTTPPAQHGHDDHLIGIREIRALFGLGRTAAYELVHHPGFPAVVPVSSHSHRWWESEVHAFATTLQAEGQQPVRIARAAQAMPGPDAAPLRIAGKMRYADRRSTSPDDQARPSDQDWKAGA